MERLCVVTLKSFSAVTFVIPWPAPPITCACHDAVATNHLLGNAGGTAGLDGSVPEPIFERGTKRCKPLRPNGRLEPEPP